MSVRRRRSRRTQESRNETLILAVLALPLLAGCWNDYEHYVKAVEAQAKWRATAEIARADAFKEAVTSSDPVVAAVAANGLTSRRRCAHKARAPDTVTRQSSRRSHGATISVL